MDIVCFICENSFSDFKIFSNHLRKIHHGLNRTFFECKKCSQKFHKIQSYDRHLRGCYKHLLLSIPNSKILPIKNKRTFYTDTNMAQTSVSGSTLTKNVSEIDNSCFSFQNKIIDYNFDDNISDSALKFTLKLHSNPNFTRQNVVDIQKDVQILTSNIAFLFKQKIEEKNIDFNHTLDDLFESCSKPFEFIKSEHLLKSELKNRNLMEDFVEFPINEEVGVTFRDGKSKLENIVNKGVLLPIEFQIKEFLKRNDKLQEMIKNRDRFLNDKSNHIRHFVQCKTWKNMISKIEEASDTILLPIGLYSDGMQYNNALGPHTESSEMLYYFFPCLDDPLNDFNTFLASIVMTKDVKSYGNGRCFVSLVEVFRKLFEDGISFEMDGKPKKVKFLLGNITGDNLAMNAILSYVQSFNANYFCRFCMCDLKETSVLCMELPQKLRTIENYTECLKKNDPKTSGISLDCIFNLLPYFHCVNNKSSDIMHDYFEGICRNTFSNLFLYLHKQKIISIEDVNRRISDFCYGKDEMRYIPSIFNKFRLEKNNMKVTAKEMWQFCYLLPIIIGDAIPLGDEMWEMSLNLIQAIELLLSSKFNSEKIELIETKIAKHNILYKKHCGNLTPKMHLATHIGTSIRYMGPPRHYMCFRMESKHIFFKKYAHIINCRKNIPVSFAIKYSLYFSNFLFNNLTTFDIELNKQNIIPSEHSIFLRDNTKCYNKINYRGSDISANMFIPHTNILFKIKEILVTDKKIELICIKIGDLNYSLHIDSYILNRSLNDKDSVALINFEVIESQPLYLYKTVDGKEVVRFKNYF